ncbi:MAG: hypothetical protein CMJ18_08090 [Phycisphaeraceae bacterium]|nr:hypothetical protein [Phycisphaeraceae bacterium]
MNGDTTRHDVRGAAADARGYGTHAFRPCSRRAFTLVELLVVISIIALLIAMLLPAIKQARGVARQVMCGSNQRQIFLAAASYADEHAGWLPFNPDPNNQPHTYDRVPGRVWDQLYGYLPDPGGARRERDVNQVVWCPDQTYWEYMPGPQRDVSPDFEKWNVGYEWRFIARPGMSDSEYFWGNPPWQPVSSWLVRSSEGRNLADVESGKVFVMDIVNGEGVSHADRGGSFGYVGGSVAFVPFPGGEKPNLGWSKFDSPLPRYEWLDLYADRH